MRILRWGIYAIVFGLPLYLVRFKIFGIPTTVLELMIYGLFIVWLISKLKKSAFFAIVKKADFFIISIILIFIGISLATILSSDLRTSAGIWKAWFVDSILFFVVLISVIKNSEQVKKILLSLFLSGTVVSIISLVYLILGKLDLAGRLQAFYNSPNYLAMYLAPALIIGFWWLCQNIFHPSLNARSWSNKLAHFGEPSENAPRLRSGLVSVSLLVRFVYLFHSLAKSFEMKYISIISCLVLFVILFFTYSYGAWFGIMAAVCFGLVLYCFKLRKKELAVLILCLFILAGLFLGYIVLNSRIASLSARLIIWQKAIEIFKSSPIFGIGPGTFGNYLPSYPEWGVPQPHNIFLAFLLQTGLLGFIGFIWLLTWFFKTGIAHQASSIKHQASILMSIMVYILVHGLVDTTYWKNDLAVIFWMVIGLMAVICSQSFVPIGKKC